MTTSAARAAPSDAIPRRRKDARGGATTESIVMRSRSGTVRRIRARHNRPKLREVIEVAR